MPSKNGARTEQGRYQRESSAKGAWSALGMAPSFLWIVAKYAVGPQSARL